MIIFLYGSDGYRLKQNVDKVVSSYRKKYQSGLNLFEFDFSENENTDTLEKAIKSSSFFNEFKLLIVKNFSINKSLSAKIVKLIKTWDLTATKDIILLAIENLTEKEIFSKSKELFKLLTEKNNTTK